MSDPGECGRGCTGLESPVSDLGEYNGECTELVSLVSDPGEHSGGRCTNLESPVSDPGERGGEGCTDLESLVSVLGECGGGGCTDLESLVLDPGECGGGGYTDLEYPVSDPGEHGVWCTDLVSPVLDLSEHGGGGCTDLVSPGSDAGDRGGGGLSSPGARSCSSRGTWIPSRVLRLGLCCAATDSASIFSTVSVSSWSGSISKAFHVRCSVGSDDDRRRRCFSGSLANVGAWLPNVTFTLLSAVKHQTPFFLMVGKKPSTQKKFSPLH